MRYGPDGMPLGADAPVEVDEEGELHPKLETHQKVEMHDQGWFHAESSLLPRAFESDCFARKP